MIYALRTTETGCQQPAWLRCWCLLKRLAGAQLHWLSISCRSWLNGLRTFCKLLLHGFRVYCQNGGFSGTRYLVGPQYHITERIFWGLVLLASFLSCVFLIINYLHTYEDNLFRMTIEDHPLTKDMDFPSIGLCEISGTFTEQLKMTLFLNSVYEKYPELNHTIPFAAFVRVLAFQTLHHAGVFTKFYETALQSPQNVSEILQTFNYAALAGLVRATCSELFVACYWNDEPFDCCEYFGTVNSMIGGCFLLNSLQTGKRLRFLNMRVSRHSEQAEVKLVFTKPAKIFVLNNDDIPETVTAGINAVLSAASIAGNIEFTIVPLVNDPDLVTNLRDDVKQCYGKTLINSENSIHTYNYVSYTACVTESIRLLQLQSCGCINYYFNQGELQPKAPYCDLRGYACLEKSGLINIRSWDGLKFSVPCLASCEANITRIVNFDASSAPDELGKNLSVKIGMSYFPQKQMRRQWIRSSLDSVVFFCGIVSLILGCNIIDIIELLFVLMQALARSRNVH